MFLQKLEMNLHLFINFDNDHPAPQPNVLVVNYQSEQCRYIVKYDYFIHGSAEVSIIDVTLWQRGYLGT